MATRGPVGIRLWHLAQAEEEAQAVVKAEAAEARLQAEVHPPEVVRTLQGVHPLVAGAEMAPALGGCHKLNKPY